MLIGKLKFHIHWSCAKADLKFFKCSRKVMSYFLIFSPGYYLYLESSYPARLGYKSQLMSHSFDPTEERCLTWWYNMCGRTVGSLTVYLINSRSGTKTSLWSKSGEQGKDWEQGFASFHSESQYRVRKCRYSV